MPPNQLTSLNAQQATKIQKNVWLKKTSIWWWWCVAYDVMDSFQFYSPTTQQSIILACTCSLLYIVLHTISAFPHRHSLLSLKRWHSNCFSLWLYVECTKLQLCIAWKFMLCLWKMTVYRWKQEHGMPLTTVYIIFQ